MIPLILVGAIISSTSTLVRRQIEKNEIKKRISEIEKKNEEYSKFNIGIVGPSRIGKTSLIYNIIELSNKILSNNVMIKPDYYTLIDINKYISERNNLLNQSEFVSDVLEATETEKEYNLFIEKNNVKIGFTLYDFRGGLIEEADEKFDKYEKKLKNCNV
nr:hypothetical protein [Spirochaetota bacterium]